MWVRNAWYVAGWSQDLGGGALLPCRILNEALVFYRKADGTAVVLEDRCSHRLAPLSKGRIEQDDLRCMYHGMKFGPDGRCTEIPGQASIPEKARVRSYPVRESGSWIWVWMGEAELADPALIPQTISTRDPDWRIGTGTLDFQADYQLLNDNLLDLSHLSFAHEDTLGRDAPQWADQRPRMTRLERGLRFQRWNENDKGSSFLRRYAEVFDLWNTYDFLVPGIFVQKTSWYPAGTASASGFGEPVAEPYFTRCDDQAVTPVDERETLYFYAAGARSQDVDDGFVAKNMKFTRAAFLEDKRIIEAQQKVIDSDPDHPMLTTSFDGGLTTFRRLVAQMVAAESEGAPAVAAKA